MTDAAGLAALARVNAETAEKYELTAGRLTDAGLQVDSLAKWTEASVAVAEAGWRSFEAANFLIDQSEAIFLKAGEDTLVRIAEYGARLAGYSYEPPQVYFAGAAQLVARGEQDALREIEATGRRLHDRYEHATGLISKYFHSAFSIAGDRSVDELATWTHLTDAMLRDSRDELLKFFDGTASTPDISFNVLRALAARGRRSALVYVGHFQGLKLVMPERVLPAFDDLLATFDPERVPEVLTAITSSMERDPARWMVIVNLGKLLGDGELFACLVKCADRLPLDDERLLSAWLSRGMAYWSGNQKAGLAYIALESARSKEILEDLRGQVNFEDWKFVFQMIVESFGVRQVKLETIDENVTYREETQLPQVDGTTIFLPESVSLFSEQDKNFGYYKVSLLHQLGYFEFGCFDALPEVNAAIVTCERESLARRLFVICEDSRVDWQLARRFKGLRRQLGEQKREALQLRRGFQPGSATAAILERVIRLGLDEAADDGPHIDPDVDGLFLRLREPGATVADSIAVMLALYQKLEEAENLAGLSAQEKAMLLSELPPPVEFRGELDVDRVSATLNIEANLDEIEEALSDEESEDGMPMMNLIDPELLDFEDIEKGDVGEGVGMLMTELKRELEELEVDEAVQGGVEGALAGRGIGKRSKDETAHVYDEWDFEIGDYRPRWCTLYEMREVEEDETYVQDTMAEHQDLARRVRSQLSNLKPEMLVKIKGTREGEELDLERSIAYLVDRKAGLTPEENIYVERQRKSRDVSTLFLLDMSASTDDIIPDPEAEPAPPGDEDDDDYLFQYFEDRRRYEESARRIIDLEKESVVLMAEALEKLGDNYSVCGFSGYGRDRVDYFLCKDFDEPYDARAKGKIGGIKPCRSTRMGPPIRHATRSLLRTGSRIKALIIISDGYPQDHDYGSDRNSRDYGLNDTMKALMEARQQGVLSYCLTVDKSGHDYLRAMCPDNQYMVIQDIEQLPEELSRVYRSLTT